MGNTTTDRRDFEGVILRRDPDGFGEVQFNRPNDIGFSGVFTHEVLQNPAIAKSCTVGTHVVGRVERKPGGFRVIRIEPAK